MYIALLMMACNQQPELKTTSEDENKEIEIKAQAQSMFGTIDDLKIKKDTKEMVDLGRLLYSEKALSGNKTQSCESCHLLSHHGAEPLKVSIGAYGKPVERNAPSTFNSGYHVAQFWDGRAPTLEEQAKGPILAAGEMGTKTKEDAESSISSIESYPPLFEKAFPDQENPITFDNIANAIAAFERTLVTSDRFDAWLNGKTYLTKEEVEGYEKFVSTGCGSCHNGALFGGNSFQKLGVLKPYRTDGGHIDLGRFNVTGNPADKEVFKVPSLRNITNTGPYFHDGSVETIEDAVRIMASIQLGKDLSQKEVDSIVSFLKTLENKNDY